MGSADRQSRAGAWRWRGKVRPSQPGGASLPQRTIGPTPRPSIGGVVSISVGAATYDRLVAYVRPRGLTLREVVETAIGYLPPADTEQVEVSEAMRALVNEAARGGRETATAALERAINAALDDAEQWAPVEARPRQTPMVAHAARSRR